MQIKELIRKKRDGEEIDPAELEAFVSAYVRGEVNDYQVAAWLMAVYFRGLTLTETSILTRCMWKSGRSFPRLPRKGFWIDKHSTGGVGDKPSLILVPLVHAACTRLLGNGAVSIPMVSGRGLGHSGGTLDKLEAVPGFSPSLSIEKALELLESNGFFMMGQTPDLAPADRLLYALRDVTSTVESIPLIVSSIMSKKLSESLDGLVFDVKTGSGAFMETEERARGLAERLLEVAKGEGLDAVALLSRMDEPLGFTAGHQIEVEECADFLSGEPREKGLQEVVLALSSWMIHLGSRRKISRPDAEAECRKELEGPVPIGLFRKMFEAQGGDWRGFQKARTAWPGKLQCYTHPAPHDGYLERVEPKAMGLLLNALGGGRNAKEDRIDPLVGLRFARKVGDKVRAGETLLLVYYRKNEERSLIEKTMRQAVQVGASRPTERSWIVGSLQ